MSVTETEEAAMVMVETGLSPSKSLKEVKIGKKLQGKCLRLIFTVSPVKFYCCYAVNMFLIVAVIALSVSLSLSEKTDIENHQPFNATCPRDWIGFGSKCFYYSEDMRNWTFSQASCRILEAHLSRFDSLEELNFLKRFKGPSDHWIGLHRKSAEHPWMWTDNTECNSSIPTRGRGETAYLSDTGISSAREYTHRKWICSKSNRYDLQVPKIFEGA